MKLLLHSCCAPCSVACVKSLRDENIEPEILWYNPNIHLYGEYKARRDCLTEFANKENLKLTMIDEYGLRFFLDSISKDQRITRNNTNEDSEKRARCEICYRLRLEKTASFAAENGYTAFCTTLLISPYQNHDAIKRIAEEAAAKFGIDFLYRDFRPLFREGQSSARAAGLYIQKYCGCVFSDAPQKTEMSKKKSNHRVSRSYGSSLQIPRDTLCNSVVKNFPIFERLTLITGEEKLEKLAQTKVLVFGAGGVGSWAAEALVRCGIGKLGIIDSDVVCASNINRQVEATTLTVGLPKAEVLKKRLLEINPACEITAWNEIFCRENADIFGIENACYVIDAIDSLNHKLDLIETICNAGVTLFSSMGMALKTDPSRIKTGSIWDTNGCPLAQHVRQGLRKRGFSSEFTVVYSDEPPQRTAPAAGERPIYGSIVTVTGSAGFLLASLVLRDITGL